MSNKDKEVLLKRYTCGCEVRETPDKFTERAVHIFPCPLHKTAGNLYRALFDVQVGMALNRDNETPESLRYVIGASMEIIQEALATASGITATAVPDSRYLALLKEPLLYIQKMVSGMFKDSDTIDFGARKLSAEKEIGKILAYIEDGSGKAVPK